MITQAQIVQCAVFLSNKKSNSVVSVNEINRFLGTQISKKDFPVNEISNELHKLGCSKSVIHGSGDYLYVCFGKLKERGNQISKQKKKKKKAKNKPNNQINIFSDSIQEEKSDQLLYDQLLNSICKKLEKLNLYEKCFLRELIQEYPLIQNIPIKISDINEKLHENGKEVTFLNGYYVSCELGFHEKRINDLKSIRMTSTPMEETPGYRDDISNMNGTFHLRRDITGRIDSDIEMDNFDD